MALEGLASGLSRPRPHAHTLLPRAYPACRRSAWGGGDRDAHAHPCTNLHMRSVRCIGLIAPLKPGGMPPSHRSLIWIFVRRHDEATREHENVKKIGADKGCRFLRPYLGVIWADP